MSPSRSTKRRAGVAGCPLAWTAADDPGDPGQPTLLRFEPHDHVIQIGEFDPLAPGAGWNEAFDKLAEALATA